MSKSKKSNISLSTNATKFNEALKAQDAAPVAAPAVAPVETVEEVKSAPVEETNERRHMTTGIVKGAKQNGIGAPAPNGKCHEAWRTFDGLTEYVGDELRLPSLSDCEAAAAARGLNKGNVRVEYPRWRKWNGFAAVTRRSSKGKAASEAAAKGDAKAKETATA